MPKNRFRVAVRELKLKLKNLFLGSGGFDSYHFQFQWENDYGKSHDPDPREVISRIRMLGESVVVCEIGAGYGRVIAGFPNSFKLIALEPNEVLFNALRKNSNIQTFQLAAKNLPRNLDVGVFFSVRALHYVGLIESYYLLSRMRRHYPKSIFIVWERKDTCRRLRLANKFALSKNIFFEELIN